MQLADFITQLCREGRATVDWELRPHSDQELDGAKAVLKQYYEATSLEMPYQAPDFHPHAALWGATYLFMAIRFVLVRQYDEALINQHLIDYPGTKTPEVIYSADLCLRFLPDLLKLAKGIAPDDILVTKIKETALEWPFSSVGIKLGAAPALEVVEAHASLRLAYRDRVIAAADKSRIPGQEMLVEAALGEHAAILWPEYKQVGPVS